MSLLTNEIIIDRRLEQAKKYGAMQVTGNQGRRMSPKHVGRNEDRGGGAIFGASR